MAPTATMQRRPTQAAPAPKSAKAGPGAAGPPKAAPPRSALSKEVGRVVPKGRAQKPVAAAPAVAGKSGLDSVKAELKAAGARQKTHDTAESAAAESQRAADFTPEQAQGQGRADQLGTMASQEKKPFDRAAFKAKLREKINQLKADDAKNIKDGDKGAQINAEVKSTVADGQKTAAGAIDTAAKQPPPAGEPKKGEALPKASPGELPNVDGGKAVPPPVPDAKVSMTAQANAIDQQMAAAKVTPKQLDKANEPAFKAASTARSKATTSATALPGNARAKERALHANAKAGQAAATKAGLAGMHGKRGAQLSAALAKQVDGKAKQEAARKRISAELTQIYTATKTSVDERLKKLDDDVATTFDDGASSAKWDFYEFLAVELLGYYLAGGWAVDLFTGGDSKEKIFDRGRAVYMKAMDRVIDQVADVVEKGLNDVVAMIADGKKKLDAAVAKMSPSDQQVAREVATGIQGQFAELEKSVEDKQNDIIDSVAKKYVAAQKDVESTINFLRNPVGALIEMAVDAVVGVIETILKMRDLLLTALAKAREAIDLIVDDPIGFLRNLVAGVKQGVNNFVTNIGTHLKKGLLEWLFGALAGAGIQLPDKFDLSGLLSIVLQVLGLTWTNIRARAVKILGEPVVKTLETASDIVKILVTKGVSGLWEYVKEQAATMLDTLKESVKSMVIENVIKAGVKWLIGLLNPASAFVKACMAIVDIVSFIIDRGQQILEFVNAVLDSVLAIAKGQIGVAAKAVEWALAKAVPVAIGFLASLLGLGDLSKDIKKVIDKIQAPVNKMIDWLINKAVALVKAVGKLLGFGKKDDAKQELAQWWVTESKFSDKSGRGHRMFFAGSGASARLKVASKEMFEDEFVMRVKSVIAADPLARALGSGPLMVFERDLKDARQLEARIESARTKPTKEDILVASLVGEHKKKIDSMAVQAHILIDILPENADPSLPVKPGQFVSIPYRGSTRKGEILVASNLHVHYYVHSVQNAKLQIPTAEFRSRWGADIFEYSERSLREEYLGATPGKATATGKIVMARYQYRTVTGVLEVEWQSGTWHPLLDCDMSHYPVDAVDEWNSRLKHTGIRSSAVRAWMNDPRNYILEPAARNRSRSSKSRYEPPTV